MLSRLLCHHGSKQCTVTTMVFSSRVQRTVTVSWHVLVAEVHLAVDKTVHEKLRSASVTTFPCHPRKQVMV